MIIFVVDPIEAGSEGQRAQAREPGRIDRVGHQIDRAAFKVQRVFACGIGLQRIVFQDRVVSGRHHELHIIAPFSFNERT